MPCYFPLAGYYSSEVNPSGKRSIVFDKRRSHSGVRIPIPCGECIGCRTVEARIWAIRCVHEKRCHAVSSFITLTYDDVHLPPGGSLSKRHVQLFMKRLRKERGDGVRFFACGEYGSRTFRPHYHLLLFSADFPDRRFLKTGPAGDSLYRSAELRSLWPYGDNVIGDVTFKSCSYVAKYVLKKVGKKVVVHGREPEFRLMSRRPGVGYEWFKRFQAEAYKHDSVIMDGREVPVPRYYDTKYADVDPDRLDDLRRLRRLRAIENRADNTHARRKVKEAVADAASKLFAREL